MNALLFFMLATSVLTCELSAQRVPDRSAEVIGTKNTEPERPASDYQSSGPGLISLVDSELLRSAGANAAASLSQAPDDESGKRSILYPTLQAWTTDAQQTATTKKYESVFALIPKMVTCFSFNYESQKLAPQLEGVRRTMESCSSVVLRAIGEYVKENGPVVPGNVLSNFVRVCSVGQFFQEGEWEGISIPIDSAGVMILDPGAVVAQLKAGPWKEASGFIGGQTTINGFYSRYAESGDGISVLKTKYAGNKSAIDAKFDELKTWVDQQEQQAGGGK